MKVRIVLLGVGLVSTFVLLMLWYERDVPIVNYPPKNEKIVAFGDSLVFGTGSTAGNDFVSLLAKKLNRPIVNLGKPGDTTTDGILRLLEVQREEPGIVILLLGGNDYLRRIDTETTRMNLGSLIQTFQSGGAVVVLLGVRGGILIDGREEMFYELSREYGAVYVPDVLKGVFGTPTRMFDGIHPNDVGYEIIAERIYQVFLEEQL